MKEDLLGVDGTDSWGTAFANRPAVAALIAAVVIGAVVFVVWWSRRLPPGDHPLTFDSDKVWPPDGTQPVPERWTDGLAEKIVLLSLILMIFSEGIPALTASIPQIIGGVVVVVAANAAVSQVLRGTRFRAAWKTPALAFVATVVLNVGIWAVVQAIIPSDDDGASRWATAFFLLLASLIIALFDRYHPRRRPAGLRRELSPAN